MEYEKFVSPEQRGKRESAVERLRRTWARTLGPEDRSPIGLQSVTLKERLNEIAEEDPSKVYIRWRDEEITYGSVNAVARRIANGMAQLGIEKGDRVMVGLKNGPLPIVVSHACFKIGAIVVCVNPLESPSDFGKKIADARPRLLFVDKNSYSSAVCSCSELGYAPDFLVLPKADVGLDFRGLPHLSIDELTCGVGDDEPACAVSPEDIAGLQFTGGTTGVVKGCRVSNRAYLAASSSMMKSFAPVIAPEDVRLLLSLPMGHIAGFLAGVVAPLMPACSVVIADGLKPSLERSLAAMERHEANVWPTIPFFLDAYKRSREAQEKYNLSSMRIITSGGAPLSETTVRWFFERGVDVVEVYGLTEMIGYATISPMAGHDAGTVGVPIPDVDVLIVDCDTGEVIDVPGVPGEIIARGISMFDGYWGNQAFTKIQVADGWTFTGDIGVLDANGVLRIAGRKKDMIISSGFNIFPQEVVNVLVSHPGIADAWVFGIPDERGGEVPAAFVIRNEGAAITERDVIEYCRSVMTHYKAPRKIVFGDVLPALGNGKPDVAALKEMIRRF